VWPTSSADVFEIKHLCSVPSHRGKGVEECLLGLALKYCAGKQARKVVIKYDEPAIIEYQRTVLSQVITEKFGFKKVI
jgi:hypothetical protein